MVDPPRLHQLVPAAEELDLLEEHADAAYADYYASLTRQAAPGEHEDEITSHDGPPDPDPDPGPTLSHGQVLGLVEHLLGGTVLGEGPADA